MGLDPKGSELGRLVVATSAGSRLADRPDVVMVPGMAVSRYLRATRDLLADDTRVHLLELPGTGRAADLSRPMSTGLPQDAAAVTWWVRSFLPGPVALVGHSYGAQVVARVAAAIPDQVVAVVLASPTVDPAFRSLPRLWARWLADTRKAPEGLGRVQTAERRRAGSRRLFAMAWSMVKDDPEKSLHDVHAPVTVVRGQRDAFSSSAWARRLAERPAGELVEIPEAPHAFPFAQPDALADAVRATLRRVGR